MSTTAPCILPADLPADIRAAVAAILANLPAPTPGPLSGRDVDLYGRISDDTKRKGTGAEGRNAVEQISDAAHTAVSLGADPARLTAHVENDRSAYKRTKVTVTMFGETFTALRVDRPVWRAMLAGLRAAPGRAVVALDLDRLARDPQDVEDAITTATLNGARWYERTGGPMNLHTSDGQMTARFKVTMANKSSSDTSRRVARAHERRQETGKPNWPTRPFGHERDGSLNPTESEAIQRAAHDLINVPGTTLYTLVKAWNAAGILPTGKPRKGDRAPRWTIATLGVMLRSPRLAALVTVGGVIREDITAQWLPILTPDRWRRMVAVLDANGAAHMLDGVTHRPTNLMSGIAECYVPGCDGRIAVNRSGSGVRHYICPRGHVRVPGDALDDHVSRWVLRTRRDGIFRPGRVPTYSPLMPRESIDTAPLAASLDAAAARVVALQEQMLTADPGVISTLAPVLARATADRNALQKQLDAANAEIERGQSFDAMLAEWAALTVDGRRGILRRMVDAGWHFQLRPFVEGEPDERIMIFYEHDLADPGDIPD